MAKTTIPSYSPRWLSGIFRFLDALPVPFWLLALIYLIAMAALRHWIAWERGLVPQGQVNAWLAINPLFSLSLIIAWLYLDRRAVQALQRFFADTGKKKSEIDQAVREFLSLSPGLASLLFIIGGIVGYFGFLTDAKVEPQAAQVLPAVFIFGYSLALGFIALLVYRLLRQIKLMRQLLANVDADIFTPQRVYALSSYGAAFALTVFIAEAIPGLPVSNFFVAPETIIGLFALGILLLIIFFVPLVDINKRMRSHKDHLLAEIGSDLSEIQQRTHLALQKKKYADVDKMRGSLSTLREQRELVQKTSTWPWQPDTLRNLLTPLLIPIIVFLVQRYLGSFLGLQ